MFGRAFGAAPWEAKVAYCRAVRAGAHVHSQAVRCVEALEAAPQELGADRSW